MVVQTTRELKARQRAYKAGKCCAFCGRKLPPFFMSVDHIIPRAFYGDAWDKSNWQVLCLECHQHKTTAETYILSGQWARVSQFDYKNMQGLEEFKNAVLCVRETLQIPSNSHIPITHDQFRQAGFFFPKKR